MARTPLLRALRQLAGEHDAAEQLGVPVEELRARREEQAYSRKDFLKRTGAIGAALAAAGPSRRARARARGATAPRIAIVGGGIAGLTLRLTLRDKGFASTVYEASGADRRPHVLDSSTHRLLGRRPGQRVVRRADRHRPPDDPRPRRALQRCRSTTCTPPSRPARPRRTSFVGALLPRRRRPTPTSCAIAASLARRPRPRRAIRRRSTRLTPEGFALDHMSVLRLDRVARARRPRVAARPAARRRLQHRVRRRDDRAVVAQPRLPARLPAEPRAPRLFGESDERFHIRGGNQRLPEAIARPIVRSQGASADAWAGGSSSRRPPTAATRSTFDAPAASRPSRPITTVVLAIPFAVLAHARHAPRPASTR